MAKKKGQYICNRCGRAIDVQKELDCIEVKAFEYRSISERVAADDRAAFGRMGDHAKYHYCSDCGDMLMKYTYGHELRSTVAEEIIRCRDCANFLTDKCPLKHCGRNDFFCGYGIKRRDGK